MSDLEKPITTQEDLDKIIGERLAREKETTAKKYGDYDKLKTANADLTTQLAAAQKAVTDTTDKYKDYDNNMAELQGKVKTYETASVKTRVALAAGLPYEMASRLNGETEEDIKKDAATLSGLIGKPSSQPMAQSEPDSSKSDSKKAALTGMLHTLKGEE